MKIIPEKFVLLEVEDELTIERVIESMRTDDNPVKYQEDEIDTLARSALTEYKLHMEGVKEVCKGYIYTLDGNKPQGVVTEDIARNLRIRNKSNAPKRAPRILIHGPPGSGRSP